MVILGWRGLPVLWSGDEIGMLNDPQWADLPEHAEDNRWAHRPALDWAAVASAAGSANTGAADDDAPDTAGDPAGEPAGHESEPAGAATSQIADQAAAPRASQAEAAARIYSGIRHLARLRAGLQQLHASVATHVSATPDPGVLSTLRDHPLGRMIGLYNVTEQERWVPG